MRTVQTKSGEISYDEDMPMGSLTDLTSAASDGNLGLIMESLAQFVISWPYKGDPSDPASWRGLRRSEFNNVTQSVMEDLGEQGNA